MFAQEIINRDPSRQIVIRKLHQFFLYLLVERYVHIKAFTDHIYLYLLEQAADGLQVAVAVVDIMEIA